MASR
ncbi:hypothetical protein CesoFtcFv8_001464 [Champsocephalus esox]|jgi:hypothetical protein